MLLQIHQINPCCKRKKAHTRLESVGSSNVSVVTTSAATPPPPPPHARKEEEIVIIIYEEEQR